MPDEIILGIDPGSHATGYGLIRACGGRLVYLESGVIRITDAGDLPARLRRLYETLSGILQVSRPDVCAVEDVFCAVNPRSALLLGHARGAAILALAQADIPVFTYSPSSVKRAVVGVGRAEKSQVQHMIRLLLALPKSPPRDASDALALAVCHANNSRFHQISAMAKNIETSQAVLRP